MESPSIQQDVSQIKTVLIVIWCASLSSIIVLGILLFVLLNNGTIEPMYDAKTISSGIAALLIFAALWLRRKIHSKSWIRAALPKMTSLDPEEKFRVLIKKTAGLYILSIVLFESAAVFVFLGAFLGGDFSHYIVMASAAFLISFFLFPKPLDIINSAIALEGVTLPGISQN